MPSDIDDNSEHEDDHSILELATAPELQAESSSKPNPESIVPYLHRQASTPLPCLSLLHNDLSVSFTE